MTLSDRLCGVVPPVTTPFDAAGEIDDGAFVAQLNWLEAAGVAGVVVGGSTGEGFTLAEDELVHLSELALDTVGARLPVAASIIVDSSRAAASRARALGRLPLAALQVAPPHYIFAPSDQGLVEFYRQVAGASDKPIIIYNVIAWANVSPGLAAEILAAVPAVAAIKQSDKNFEAYVDLVERLGADRVFAAIDGGLMSCYELGARGSIPAVASAAPRASVALWNAVRDGRRQDALTLHRRLLALWQTLAGPELPARVKLAQMLQGVPANHPRSPMTLPGAAERGRIAGALAALDATRL